MSSQLNMLPDHFHDDAMKKLELTEQSKEKKYKYKISYLWNEENGVYLNDVKIEDAVETILSQYYKKELLNNSRNRHYAFISPNKSDLTEFSVNESRIVKIGTRSVPSTINCEYTFDKEGMLTECFVTDENLSDEKGITAFMLFTDHLSEKVF